MVMPVAHKDCCIAVLSLCFSTEPFNKAHTIIVMGFAVLSHAKVNVSEDCRLLKHICH
jgi:hypothetical protein